MGKGASKKDGSHQHGGHEEFATTIPPFPAVPLELFPEFSHAEGVYLYTSDGRGILDAAGQACVANIGYGRKEVADVAARALMDFTHALPPLSTPQRLRLVERLIKSWLPEGLTQIHFANSGSEAADTAIKLARQYHLRSGNPGKWKIIGRQASYHGVTLGGLSVSGHTARRAGFEPLLTDFPLAPACYPLRCESCSKDGGCNLACADAVEAIILREGPETVSAFMAEAIVGTSGGALVPPDDYWPRIQDICQRHDVLLIIDEVLTGFGRTGKRFAVEHWDIKPDIMTTAKGFTGGYAALSAVITTPKIVLPLAEHNDMIMFHTFGGHPAACAVADKVLEIMEREQLVERANEMGAYLGAGLLELEQLPNVAEVRGKGMLWAVELVQDKETGERFPEDWNVTYEVLKEGFDRGVFYYMGGTGEHRDIVCLGPPFTITNEEADTMVSVLKESIGTVMERLS